MRWPCLLLVLVLVLGFEEGWEVAPHSMREEGELGRSDALDMLRLVCRASLSAASLSSLRCLVAACWV